MMILIGRGTVPPPAIQSTHPTPGPAVTEAVPSRVRRLNASKVAVPAKQQLEHDMLT